MIDLSKVRKEKGLTLRALSAKVGVSASYLNLIENGKREPPVKVAKKIAEVLEIYWAEIYE